MLTNTPSSQTSRLQAGRQPCRVQAAGLWDCTAARARTLMFPMTMLMCPDLVRHTESERCPLPRTQNIEVCDAVGLRSRETDLGTSRCLQRAGNPTPGAGGTSGTGCRPQGTTPASHSHTNPSQGRTVQAISPRATFPSATPLQGGSRSKRTCDLRSSVDSHSSLCAGSHIHGPAARGLPVVARSAAGGRPG